MWCKCNDCRALLRAGCRERRESESQNFLYLIDYKMQQKALEWRCDV